MLCTPRRTSHHHRYSCRHTQGDTYCTGRPPPSSTMGIVLADRMQCRPFCPAGNTAACWDSLIHTAVRLSCCSLSELPGNCGSRRQSGLCTDLRQRTPSDTRLYMSYSLQHSPNCTPKHIGRPHERSYTEGNLWLSQSTSHTPCHTAGMRWPAEVWSAARQYTKCRQSQGERSYLRLSLLCEAPHRYHSEQGYPLIRVNQYCSATHFKNSVSAIDHHNTVRFKKV